jgi:hypothetical protein
MQKTQKPDLPTFRQLDAENRDPPRSTWGAFGESDEVGMLNLLGHENALGAASLDYMLFAGTRHGRDDYLDNYYPQGSTQWDGLRHVRHPEFGFYNGVPDDDVNTPGRTRLGVQNCARWGIVGRGVLLDVYGHAERSGRPFNPSESFGITVEMLRETAKAQGVGFEPAPIGRARARGRDGGVHLG